MTCLSITIIQQKPVISALVGAARSTQGEADIQWSQDIAGSITISVDGVTVQTQTYPAGQNTARLTGLSIATHNICVNAT